jgi:ABC-2 type transport system permease protein
MVLGKITGGTMIALVGAAVFLLLGFTLSIPLGLLSTLATLAHLALIGLGLTSLGFALAWAMDSTQGYHAIMSVFLLPMWLLSGAFFPPGDNWVGWIIRLNPLTYAVAGLRRLLYLDASDAVRAQSLPADLPGGWTCAIVTLLFVVAMFALAWKVSARRTTGDLL